MPGNDLVVGLRLTANGKGFVGEVRVAEEEMRKLRSATDRAEKTNRDYNRSARESADATGRLSRAMRSAHRRVLEYGGAALGLTAVSRTFRAITANTVRQEQALAQVEARIRSTSGAAGLTTAQLARMAAGFQRVTSFGDEAILEAQSVLLSFRNLSGDVIEGATEATLNLSTALGQDLRSAAIQLGKALDDPARGLTALSRSGTTFSDAQKQLIADLVETGDKAAAQQIILRELEVQYGGAAEAARNTLGGALQALSNTWGDLLESSNTGAATTAINGLNSSLQALSSERHSANLERMNAAIGAVAVLLAVRYRGALLGAATATGRVIFQTGALSAAAATANKQALTLSAGMRALAVSAGVLRTALAFLTGPAGLILLAIYAIYEFVEAGDSGDAAVRDFAAGLDIAKSSAQQLTEKLGALTRAQREVLLLDAQNKLNERENFIGFGAPGLLQQQERAQDAVDVIVHKQNNALAAAGVPSDSRLGRLLEKERLRAQGELDAITAQVKQQRASIDKLKRGIASANALDAFGGAGGAVGSAGSSTGRAGLPVDEDEIARRYDATRRALQSARERIEADHAAHIANIESADISKAERDAQRVRADAVRRRQLAALPAGNQALIAVQRALRSETEKLNDTWRDNQRVILAGTVAGSRLRQELLRRNAAERDGAIATLEDTRARESGVLALQNARQENQRLGEQAGLTTAQIDRQNRALARELELRRTYPEATQSVLTALGQELSARDDILARQERQAGLLERYAPDTAIAAGSGQREDDLEALHEQRLLSETEYQRALTESQLIAERERQQAIIELKREGWEQELIEAQGYRDRLAQADAQAAHQRINANAAITLPGQERLLNQFADLEQQSGAARVQTALSVGTELTAAAAGQNRKAFRLHQAASIAQAIVSTYSAAAAAYDDFQTPYNYIAAAAVTAAGLAQVSAIRAQQPPQAFAAGGVVEGATFFSARGIPRGLAGEAGPEAIVPLARGPGGALGVRAFGSASPSVTIAPVIQVTVTESADADPAATGATIGRAIQAVLVPAVRQVLAEEQRSGGLLNREDKV